MVLKRHWSSVTFPEPFRISSDSSTDAHLAALLHFFWNARQCSQSLLTNVHFSSWRRLFSTCPALTLPTRRPTTSWRDNQSAPPILSFAASPFDLCFCVVSLFSHAMMSFCDRAMVSEWCLLWLRYHTMHLLLLWKPLQSLCTSTRGFNEALGESRLLQQQQQQQREHRQ